MLKEKKPYPACPVNDWSCPYFSRSGHCLIDGDPMIECDEYYYYMHDDDEEDG